MSDSRQLFITMRDKLNAHLLERETAVDLGIMALLTREHLLMLGPPGTAKSLLTRYICSCIGGAKYFERLLTKFSTPEELYGPLSLAALENDQYKRITTNTALDSEILFVDEIWKANSAILNSLLTLINERIYHEGGQVVQAPLLSMFSASNELPEDNSLNALFDRCLLRIIIPYLTDDNSFRQLFDLPTWNPEPTVSIQQLLLAQEEVQRLALSDETKEALVTIWHELSGEGVIISDRRWRACGNLIKANAWMLGEDNQTTAEHCDILVHALWSDPNHISVVGRIIARISNPLTLEAIELEDAAKDLYDQRPKPDAANLTQALEPLLRQMNDLHTRLDTKIANASGDTRRAGQALTKISGWYRELSQMALKSISRLHLAPGK